MITLGYLVLGLATFAVLIAVTSALPDVEGD